MVEDVPEDMVLLHVDARGTQSWSSPPNEKRSQIIGDLVNQATLQHTWVIREWREQQKTYHGLAFPLFSARGEYQGVISLAFPKNYRKELQRLRHDHEVFHWILEISRYVLFESRSEDLWSQFRDLFLQFFQVQGGGFLKITDLHLQEFEWFGSFQIPSEMKEKMKQAALVPIDSTQNLKSLTFDYNGTVYHVLRHDWIRGRNHRDVLYLFHDPIDEEESAAFLSLMNFYHLAVEVVEQREILQRKTNEDPLTGVWNRRALEAHMEMYYALSHPSPAAFVLFDLDHFKELNDTRGHQAGDIALQEVARHFRKRITKKDWIARIGGDEWVLVLHEVDENFHFSAKVREWMENSPFGSYGLGLTGGYVEIPREAGSYQDAYRLADHRLYEGKRGGRNRIVGPDFTVLLALD